LTAESSQTYQEGLTLLEKGAHADADARLNPLLAVEPGNVELMLRIGQARILSGKAEEARELLAKAKSLNPQESEVVLWYGRALFLRGRHQAALEELRRARRMSGESELASIWLSESLVALGARAQAFQALEQDLKYYPAHLQVLTQLARFRVLFFDQDPEMLLAARKEVQLGLSRLTQYLSPAHPRTEGPLGLQLVTADEIRTQLRTLMDRIESKQAELKLRKD
jgi:predicted Zn-dependent protease